MSEAIATKKHLGDNVYVELHGEFHGDGDVDSNPVLVLTTENADGFPTNRIVLTADHYLALEDYADNPGWG